MHLRRQLLRLEYQKQTHDDCPCPPPAAVDNLGFILLPMEDRSPICYFEYDENEKSYKKVKIINHPPLKKRTKYMTACVGSCNGLVCFSIPCRYGIGDPIYICNLITKEFINLPKLTKCTDYKDVVRNKKTSLEHTRVVSGFGYNASTNEYKVVRIIYYDTMGDPIIGRVQVYTLGDGNGWRKKGEITHRLIPLVSYRPVSRGLPANGALHWRDFAKWRIVAIDLEKEEFNLLPSPPCFHRGAGENNYFELQVLGERLCVTTTDRDSHSNRILNIWSFNKSRCEWESMFRIPYDNWVPLDFYMPIALTMRGEVLLRWFPFEDTFLRYDPKTETAEKHIVLLEDLGADSGWDEAVPHKSSFVSLRALGEIPRKIKMKQR